VKQKARSCGFRGLYESAGRNMATQLPQEQDRSGEGNFCIAREYGIAHTVSIETIKYG
jgi:hypothetical protein